jgi:Predicted secreted protein
VNETFIAPETEVVGAGGVHRWQYVAAEPGSAEFTAIYRRPWEEATGNETTFSTDFIIR